MDAGPVDWGAGSYERIAVQLAPAAAEVVRAADPSEGERLLDIGCGTGSATIMAAERGADATGVDPSEGLLERARSQAAARGVRAEFLRGTAEEIPMPDATADVIVSSFGVIFAPDPRSAAAEIGRVAAPAARLALSAWIPGGAMGEVARMGRAAVQGEGGAAPFPWHEAEALQALLGAHGFTPTLSEQELAFTADSPEAFIDSELENHPLWVLTARAIPPERLREVRERAVEVLTERNEDPDAFRVTSRYVIATARRS